MSQEMSPNADANTTLDVVIGWLMEAAEINRRVGPRLCGHAPREMLEGVQRKREQRLVWLRERVVQYSTFAPATCRRIRERLQMAERGSLCLQDNDPFSMLATLYYVERPVHPEVRQFSVLLINAQGQSVRSLDRVHLRLFKCVEYDEFVAWMQRVLANQFGDRTERHPAYQGRFGYCPLTHQGLIKTGTPFRTVQNDASLEEMKGQCEDWCHPWVVVWKVEDIAAIETFAAQHGATVQRTQYEFASDNSQHV